MAVEVELSHKSPRRLQAILAGHEQAIASGRIAGGLIYVSDRARRAGRGRARAAARAAMPERRFRTRALADVQAEVRRLTCGATRRHPADGSGAASGSARRARTRSDGGIDERGGGGER